MKKNKLRLLLFSALLTGTALVSTARQALACVPEMCWMVDAYTTCCWTESCDLWCG
jgi:hypothetical protein